ncbi:hypothetical protein A6R68_11819, partial [Neotoma lepida]
MSLTHLTFRKEFTEAVEVKQVAQQKVDRDRFAVEKAEQQERQPSSLLRVNSRTAELINRQLTGHH